MSNVNNFVGASSEYRAAAWYLNNGWNVFWPSVQQTDIDFVVLDPCEEGLMYKIQVKTAYREKDKIAVCRIHRTEKEFKEAPKRWDRLVVVDGDANKIWEVDKEDIPSARFILKYSDAFTLV